MLIRKEINNPTNDQLSVGTREGNVFRHVCPSVHGGGGGGGQYPNQVTQAPPLPRPGLGLVGSGGRVSIAP